MKAAQPFFYKSHLQQRDLSRYVWLYKPLSDPCAAIEIFAQDQPHLSNIFDSSKEYHRSYNHESLPRRNHLHVAFGRVACGAVPRLRPRRPTSLLLCRKQQRQRHFLLLQRLHRRQLRQHRSISSQRPHLLSRRRSHGHQCRLRRDHLPGWFCHTTYRQRNCGQHCCRCHQEYQRFKEC